MQLFDLHQARLPVWFVPRASLHLHSPTADLSTYTFNQHRIKHQFCPTCGVAPFGMGTDGEGNATGGDQRALPGRCRSCAALKRSAVTTARSRLRRLSAPNRSCAIARARCRVRAARDGVAERAARSAITRMSRTGRHRCSHIASRSSGSSRDPSVRCRRSARALPRRRPRAASRPIISAFRATRAIRVRRSRPAYVDLERVRDAGVLGRCGHALLSVRGLRRVSSAFSTRRAPSARQRGSQRHGNDTAIEGAAAYSTLGWFADPILSSMLRWSDDELDGVIFHELAHQLLYVEDDTAFNESFATFVQQRGSARMARGARPAATGSRRRDARDDAFTALVLDLRERLRALYTRELDARRPRARRRQSEIDGVPRALQTSSRHRVEGDAGLRRLGRRADQQRAPRAVRALRPLGAGFRRSFHAGKRRLDDVLRLVRGLAHLPQGRTEPPPRWAGSPRRRPTAR